MGKIGWAVTASILLHGICARLFWTNAPPHATATKITPLQIIFTPAPTEQSTTLPPLGNPPPVNKPIVPATQPQPFTQPDTPSTTDMQEVPSPMSAGYLPINEVDQPAMPLDDWAIDTNALPRGYTLHLVLDIWISANGKIDKWELVDASPNQEIALKTLYYLDNARIQAAVLNNIAVPSFRRLEIVVNRE